MSIRYAARRHVRTAASALAAVALVTAVSGCTGDKKPPAPTSSGSSSSSPSADPASTLAKAVIAAGSTTASPTTPASTLGSVTLQPPVVTDPIAISVTRLLAKSDETLLQLSASMVNQGTTTIPRFFSPQASYKLGDLSPSNYLNWLSVVDSSSDTTLYPYQYRWQPTTPAKLACVCMSEPLLRQQPQVWTLVLPPLPSGTTSVDVVIPRGLSDSSALASAAIATIKNVAVTRG